MTIRKDIDYNESEGYKLKQTFQLKTLVLECQKKI